MRSRRYLIKLETEDVGAFSIIGTMRFHYLKSFPRHCAWPKGLIDEFT